MQPIGNKERCLWLISSFAIEDNENEVFFDHSHIGAF